MDSAGSFADQLERTFISKHAETTTSLGRQLGARLQGGELILLDGQLGAGKTTFTQGLAAGLGISETINSPTFTLLKEYRRQRLPLYHFDLYRLEHPDEMLDLGFDDYFEGRGVCVVEWAERAGDYWPAEKLAITLKHASPDQRILHIHARGEHYVRLLSALELDH